MTLPPEVWDGAARHLAESLPAFVYDAWIAPLSPRIVEDRLHLACPTAFHRERVRLRYLPAISDALRAEIGDSVRVVLEAGAQAPAQLAQTATDTPHEPPSAPATPPAQPISRPRPATRRVHPRHAASETLDAAADVAEAARPAAFRARERREPRQRDFSFSFDNFVVGRGNALAREAALALARGDQPNLSRLVIASPAGMGKTHLARAVVREARARKEGRVVYAPAEAFTNAFTESVRTKQMSLFKRRFREGCSLLVLEDVEFLAGKRGTQLELFHTIQQVIDQGGRLLLTSQCHPSELETLEPCLRSQIQPAFIAELTAPDATHRRGILRGKAASGGIHLPDECLARLAAHPSTSVRELEGLLIQVVTTSSLLGRKIDMRLVDEVFSQKARKAPATGTGDGRPKPNVQQVIEIVAKFWGVSAEALASRSRRRDVLLPRQIAMYLARRYTDASVSEIGWAFGRQHTAVRNAVEKIEREILERAPLRYRIEAVSGKLEELIAGHPDDDDPA